MNKVITLGANGRLGSAFWKHGKFDGYRKFFRYDKLSSADFCDQMEIGEGDIVINCSAYTDVGRAVKEPTKCMETNYCLPVSLTQKSRERGFKLVNFSSDYVIRPEYEGPYKDSKVSMEKICGSHSLIIRLSNLIGENDFGMQRQNIVTKILGRKFIKEDDVWFNPTLVNKEAIEILEEVILNTPTGKTINCFGPDRYFPAFVREIAKKSCTKIEEELNFERKVGRIQEEFIEMPFDWSFLKNAPVSFNYY